MSSPSSKQVTSTFSVSRRRRLPGARQTLVHPLVQQIISASTGAMITSVLVTPLDVVRTRLQVQSRAMHTEYFYNGTTDAVRKIVRLEGVRGLWRGLTPSLLMQIPASGIYYSMYEEFKGSYARKLTSVDPLYVPLFAGFSARILAAIISTPFEYFRTQIQSQSNVNWLQILRNTNWRTQPFTGGTITVLRDAPFSAIYWFSYELLKEGLGSTEMEQLHPFWTHFSAGALAGSIAATCTIPIDVVKTRIQAAHSKKQIWDAVTEIYREDKFIGFTRGLVPRLLKVAPSCALMIATYEGVKEFFYKE